MLKADKNLWISEPAQVSNISRFIKFTYKFEFLRLWQQVARLVAKFWAKSETMTAKQIWYGMELAIYVSCIQRNYKISYIFSLNLYNAHTHTYIVLIDMFHIHSTFIDRCTIYFAGDKCLCHYSYLVGRDIRIIGMYLFRIDHLNLLSYRNKSDTPNVIKQQQKTQNSWKKQEQVIQFKFIRSFWIMQRSQWWLLCCRFKCHYQSVDLFVFILL